MRWTRQRLFGPVCALLLAFVWCAGCSKAGGNGDSSGTAAVGGTSSGAAAADGTAGDTAPTLAVDFADEDTAATWDDEAATLITLSGSTVSIAGQGVSASGTTITITAAGTYVVEGTLSAGQIVVDAGKEATVRLVLNGASITCADSAAIYAKQAAKTILTLADGTQNTLIDGTSYTYPDAQTDEPDAALFAKDDLTINGGGTLTVTGNYQHGIVSRDTLTITGGTLAVTAAQDAIRGRDGLAVQDGSFTLTAGGDGLKANNDTDTEKGWIAIEGGTFHITANNDGIQAETTLQITGGTFNIEAGRGAEQGGGTRSDSMGPGDWGWSSGTTTTDTESHKGLKAAGSVTLTGGTFTVDAADDAIHSNGTISIAGGTYSLSTGDDGIHADSTLTIEEGTIDILTSYEGLESESVTVAGGSIRLKASDDGLNATSGSGTMPGQGDGSSTLRITGGTLYVDADGDGIDSNSTIFIEGGTTLVCGPTSSGNGALDYDGTCTITGGVLIATGSRGMAQTPGSDSSQASLFVTYSASQAAGTLLALTDADGNPIAAFSPAKSYQTVLISAPDLKTGESYTLYTGGTGGGTQTNGLYTAYTPGEKLTDVTLSDMVTSISDNGGAAAEGMGGFGGGMGGRPGRR